MLLTYTIVFIILFVLAFIYLKVADHFNIIDKPNQRSSHVEPTIRGGGIIFYLAIVIFYITSNFEYTPFFLAVSLIAAVSFIDDLIMLSPKIRLIAHFSTAFLLIWQLGLLTSPFWLLILIPIVIVGFFNLYNFMDGLNGMTGLYSIIVLSGFLWINIKEEIVANNLIVFVLLSLVVFGFLNFRKKAKWFAGDIGSMTLATLIFFLGAKFMIALNAPIIILIIVIYGIDASFTIFLRMSRKEKISEAHRHHLYQKFVDVSKWSHLKVSSFYAILQLLIVIVILYTYKTSWTIQFSLIAFTIGTLGAAYFLAISYYKRIEH
ncbi:UDP-GlcNAc--UDP-phosphate GlcNAc-1-phosphate transferase [Aureibaculum algae]|uniref:UDP-GlcNAc--UDP-phosphate GlcNAc-1-phosphate transferase n=1 Tax=Aureibaculum algae TaxID=2584122 RepID=A0A5B7TR96_9FLAO|nr:UDP-GlcNAc--UDP-phosphate GlcNAc-1-phosphate transferase [Aureibaculum algae]QCX38830.1 UDP-GlcNAc--UDP-phosphate GlcNAc-1-phosphate transferase [Aureibaculum algae]